MNVKEKVLAVLIETIPQIEGCEEENLIERGLIDSFEIVNVVLALEDAFDIIIEPELVVPENFESLESIGKLVASIQENDE